MLAAYHHPPRDRPRKLVRFLKLILARDPPPPPLPRARRFFTFEQEMGRRRWPVAQLDTLADLAALLDLSPGRLDWFADVRGMERRVESEQLRNYRYLWLRRPGGPPRGHRAPQGPPGREQVCGIVVNEHLNVTRKSYDELKAILHNAARHGLAAENRAGRPDFRAHLLGRIAWVEQLNPSRGQKLRRRFAQIYAD